MAAIVEHQRGPYLIKVNPVLVERVKCIKRQTASEIVGVMQETPQQTADRLLREDQARRARRHSCARRFNKSVNLSAKGEGGDRS